MNYKLIEKVIDLIPSKDLKKVYKEDLSKGIYPEWTEEECLTIANMSWHSINEEIDYFKKTVSLINDDKIKNSMEVWINELIHRGKKRRWPKHPDFIEKYVKIKTLYKGGELVRHWWNYNRKLKLHSVICIMDYDAIEERLKDRFDYTDVCYNCLDIGDWKVDFDNPYDIFRNHSHPMKVDVELADISELSEKEKMYYDVIMNRYLHCDAKKVFEEYDRKHGKL